MSMREKIAAHVYKAMIWARTQPKGGPSAPDWFEGGNSLAQEEARAQSSAIMASLPDMIKPLEWERADLSAWGEYAEPMPCHRYSLTWKYGEGPNGEDTFFTAEFNNVVFYSGWGFDADTAYAAANTHHVATIMGAFE